MYRTSDFDFDLPPEQVAQQPSQRRDRSRLLVVRREEEGLEHGVFTDIERLIPAGDVLVLNETRVFPARLLGRKPTGAAAEVLLLRPASDAGDVWTALVRPGAKLKAGAVVEVAPELSVEVQDVLQGGERRVRLHTELPLTEALERFGEVPLPPYIERTATEADRERYQTVYAREPGSVAAPTAGLHFTPALLDSLQRRGVRIARLVLHVGVGTFRPVEAEDPAEHRMHSEWYRVPAAAAEAVNSARAAGGKVWAVGTTCVRTLESAADADGTLHPAEGWTDIFIRPPYRFRCVDRIITNFHLPRSTLLMLVTAFGGYELVMRAYHEAVREGYRFYSYGDAMVLV